MSKGGGKRKWIVSFLYIFLLAVKYFVARQFPIQHVRKIAVHYSFVIDAVSNIVNSELTSMLIPSSIDQSIVTID